MCDKLDNRRTKFILAARERHGGKYDYSQVVFTEESYCKVTIICPVHGPFVQAASAHLQRQKNGTYSGCRQCGYESRPDKQLCDDCGCVNKYNAGRPVCRDCAKKRMSAKKLRTAMKYSCSECGKPTGSRDRVYCSSKCRTAKNRVKVQCSYCNTEIVKPAYRVQKYKKLFCNPECQRLGMIGNGDPNYASKKAKEDWIKAERKRRQKQSISYKWWRLCNRKIPQPVKCGAWERRCRAAVSSLANRCAPALDRPTRDMPLTWAYALMKSIKKIHGLRNRCERNPWKKRCDNGVRSLKGRRRRKNEKQAEAAQGKYIGTNEKDRGPAVQMRFEWY